MCTRRGTVSRTLQENSIPEVCCSKHKVEVTWQCLIDTDMVGFRSMEVTTSRWIGEWAVLKRAAGVAFLDRQLS